MTRLGRALVVALAIGSAAPAQAQSTSETGPGRLELAVGALWIGGAQFGTRDANETTGSGGTMRLFSSSTELASGSGLEARIAVRLTRPLEAEAFMSYTKPPLETRIDSDSETSNAPLTVSGTIRQFIIGGAAIWYPNVPRRPGRVRVFLRGGVGHLRQLENDGTLIVTGAAYEAGGGVKMMFASRDAGWWKGIGARADARAVIRQNGVAFDDRVHVSPAVGASILVRF